MRNHKNQERETADAFHAPPQTIRVSSKRVGFTPKVSGGLPGAPTGVTVANMQPDGSLVVTFTNHGSGITGQNVYVNGTLTQASPYAPGSPITVTPGDSQLVAALGTTAGVIITAINAVGEGAMSSPALVLVTWPTPLAPLVVDDELGGNTVTVNNTDPVFFGAMPAPGVNVYAGPSEIVSGGDPPTLTYDDNPPTGGPNPVYTVTAALEDGTIASLASPGTTGPN